jgi:hypothetical protein
MSSWTLILFQMLLPKFVRMLSSTLLLKPLLLLLLLRSLCPFTPAMKLPPEFTKELEVREVVPEGQAASPSLAAFNKSFGTSHHGELLSVGFKATSTGSGASKTLTLWKSPALVDETGGEGSEQTGEAVRDSGRGPHSALKKTSSS